MTAKDIDELTRVLSKLTGIYITTYSHLGHIRIKVLKSDLEYNNTWLFRVILWSINTFLRREEIKYA